MIPFFEHSLEPLLRKSPRINAYLLAHGPAVKNNLKAIALICLFILFIACYRAWSFEHNNAENAMYGKDGKAEAWSKYNQCEVERTSKSHLADTYASLLSSQQSQLSNLQSTLNTCVFAVAKTNAAEPTHIIVKEAVFPAKGLFGVPFEKAGNRDDKYALDILVLSANKFISPVIGTLTCKTSFGIMDALPALSADGGTMTMRTRPQMISANKARIQMNSPGLNPDTPMVVGLFIQGNSVMPCDFKLD